LNAPLSGIRVIEFSRGAAAAYCGLLLADMGADVILVDDPVDDNANDNSSPLGASAQVGLRRNKRSVALDLLTLDGRNLAHSLVRGADVLVECLPPGTLARAGLGYDALSAVQPHLVYVSISAFGQDGPRASPQSGVPALDALRGMLGASPGGLEPPATCRSPIWPRDSMPRSPCRRRWSLPDSKAAVFTSTCRCSAQRLPSRHFTRVSRAR